MKQALECIEASFVAQHAGAAVNRARERIFQPGFSLHYMAAAMADEHLAGMKIYTITSGAARFLLLLFDVIVGVLVFGVLVQYLGLQRTSVTTDILQRLRG